jgi:hypothetical protein
VVLALDLVLVERNVDTREAMGSTALTATQPARPRVCPSPTVGSSMTRGIHLAVDVLHAGIGVQQRPSCIYQMLARRQQDLACVRRVESLRYCPRQDLAREVVHHGLKVDPRAVDQLDDTGIDMPDLVWAGGTDTEGGLVGMDVLARPAPAMLTNELRPGCRGGEDLADALGVASKGAKRQVPVLVRQHHLFDGGHFDAGELARTRPWTRRPVGEVAGFLCSPPGMVAPRFEADDVQDGSQGKECIGTGDGAKEPSLRLSFRKTIFVEGEAGSTKQSEQEANNGGEDPALGRCQRLMPRWVSTSVRPYWAALPPYPTSGRPY